MGAAHHLQWFLPHFFWRARALRCKSEAERAAGKCDALITPAATPFLSDSPRALAGLSRSHGRPSASAATDAALKPTSAAG